MRINHLYSNQLIQTHEFGLIGWSKDGLFAYREILSDGGIGTYADNIIIYNLKNDEIVESFSFSISDEYDGIEYPPRRIFNAIIFVTN